MVHLDLAPRHELLGDGSVRRGSAGGFYDAADRIHNDCRLFVVDKVTGSTDHSPVAVLGQLCMPLLGVIHVFHSLAAPPLGQDDKRLLA